MIMAGMTFIYSGLRLSRRRTTAFNQADFKQARRTPQGGGKISGAVSSGCANHQPRPATPERRRLLCSRGVGAYRRRESNSGIRTEQLTLERLIKQGLG